MFSDLILACILSEQVHVKLYKYITQNICTGEMDTESSEKRAQLTKWLCNMSQVDW